MALYGEGPLEIMSIVPLSRILENTVINKSTICWVETDNDFKMYWMVANKVKPEVTDYKHVFFEQSL